MNPGPVPEWPLLGLKNRSQIGNWASGVDATRAGWSTASEGRPGWASPVGSTLSEQSLASLRGLRLGGASPAPVSPSVQGASLKSVQSGGSYEVRGESLAESAGWNSFMGHTYSTMNGDSFGERRFGFMPDVPASEM